jgi:thioredoxin 1
MPITKIDDFQSFQAEIESAERILVKFEADWCMPCRAMASIVEEVAKQYPDVKVVAVDIDGEGMEKALEKYKVKAVPTFVHLKSGTATKSTSGTISKDELSTFLREE